MNPSNNSILGPGNRADNGSTLRNLSAALGETDDRIAVGASGKMEIPREELELNPDDGAELDLAEVQGKKIRKPGRHEWIILRPQLELTTRLLPYKLRPDAIDPDYYYIDKALRGQIHDELRQVRVFPLFCQL
jgi:hypothetical protein